MDRKYVVERKLNDALYHAGCASPALDDVMKYLKEYITIMIHEAIQEHLQTHTLGL